MFLYGDVEFRGINERKSKEGNFYNLIVFEDLLTSDQIRLYNSKDNDFTIPRNQLVKGCNYHCKFDYRYNSFNREFQLDLIDIVSSLDKKKE